MSKGEFMENKTYSEKLKDPRWQKKRLEIMERDGWACSFCGDKESTLHIHHIEYKPYGDPWEYPNHLMFTLCESCHAEEYEGRNITEQTLLGILRRLGFSTADLLKIQRFFLNKAKDKNVHELANELLEMK